MAKSLKKAAVEEKQQLAGLVVESASQIWLAGLGAFAKAQAEGTKVFETLVEAGKEIEGKGRKVAESGVSTVTGKASETWDKLEQVFQDRVARSLAALGVPSNDEIKQLNSRIDELTKSVNELIKKKDAAAKATAKAKPAAPAAEEAAK